MRVRRWARSSGWRPWRPIPSSSSAPFSSGARRPWSAALPSARWNCC